MNAIEKLHQSGQSLWYDNIQRRLLESGEMAQLIARGDIRGVTSNPSIFHAAIARSHDYDSSLLPMAWSGWSAEQIFNQLALEDIRAAADLFLPLYQESKGGDGYVSLEVNPYLANDTAGTVAEAKRLWDAVQRPNLMIKIPATEAGIPAVREVIAAGINVNVTLIFSLDRYRAVMDAFLQGLEQRSTKGLPIQSIASVASFFVSRVDTKVDARLHALMNKQGAQAKQAKEVLGKAAIANARLAYALFQKTFASDRFEALKAKGAQVQRPLWASTSTKDPSYRDVMYIEELIGPNTVNTVPPQTLDAFREHGVTHAGSLTKGLDEMRKALAVLADLGISMDEITDQLEVEGVKAFSDAYTALLAAIDERSAAAVAELGPLAEAVQKRVQQLADENAAHSMATHQASFWTDDPAAQAEIRKRMGWMDAPVRSLALLDDLKALVKAVQAEGYRYVLLLGMGGSSLAPEVFSDTFGAHEVNGKPGLVLKILDSTDPAQVRAAARWSPLEKTLYIVSSKSGSTSEVHAYFNYFWARAKRRLGERAADHFVAITDPGTSLEKLGQERKFRHVFLADPTVGGRFSALTAFGLVPAGLLGIDIEKLLARGAWMADQCAAEVPAGRNPGLVLGAVLGEAYLQGRDKLTFIADAPISHLGAWLEQLTAESSGKQGKGIVPIDLEPPLPPSRYAADRVFAYLRIDGAQEARVGKIRKTGQPALTLALGDVYDMGAEFFRWEYAIAVACAIMGVDAFDQPDVQDNKDRTTAKVKLYRETHKLDEGKPIWEGEGGRIYGWSFPGLDKARTLADAVRLFVEQSREGDYIAINAYVPRNPRTFASLQQLRASIGQKTDRATTLGFGPRFLHSTGQLHKGGADNGLFLQITHEPAEDFEIPTEQISFGSLERAQSLGDLEALLARGKRAIRVHMVDAAIKDLLVD